MALPPLYKYLDVRGAKLTLSNRCLRFAKPSEFKDSTDMTAEALFPDELKKALVILADGFVDAIMANLYAAPTCSPKQRLKIEALQMLFRVDPSQAPKLKAGLRKDPEKNGLNLAHWKTQSDAFVKITNEFLQNYRVLCVTTDKASERMWREYAEAGQGIALRIAPSEAKDSKFLKFVPVTYQEKRPPVYAKTIDFAAETMFGDQFERARGTLEGIIYVKTNDYRFESEYRLAIPLGEGEEDYRVLAYHPEEISELYLGAAMKDADKQEIIATSKALNPTISVFQAKQDQDGQIGFDAV